MSNKAAHYITAKIGDAGVPWHVCSTPPPSWTLDQPGTVKVGSGPPPTLRDRQHDEHDAKCNVAEIGAVNMGEIGAVRKRSR